MDDTTGLVVRGEELAMAVSEAQRNLLTQSTPRRERKTRPGRGNKTFTYVEHGWVTEQLNLAFGWNWDFRVLEHETDNNGSVVLGQLTVRTPNATIVKEQFGEKTQPSQGAMTKGSLRKAAASDCLKKCASLLGIALDLYRSEGEDHDGQEPSKRPMKMVQPEEDDLQTAMRAVGLKLRNKLAISGREQRWGWVVDRMKKPPEALTLNEWLDLSSYLDTLDNEK